MKRRLSPEAEKLTRRGIKKAEEKIKEFEEQLILQIKSKQYLEIKREYEDFIRPYNRKEQDKNINQSIDLIKEKIEIEKNSIKISQKQIREGVEQKDNLAVK